MDEKRLLSDVRLGYTDEKRILYEQALMHKIPAIRPEVGQFLSLLVSLVSPSSLLEIGTGSGYSTLWLLRYLPERARIVTVERDKNRYREALALFYQKPVEVVYGEAEEFLKDCGETFEMVFLDAEKRMYRHLLPYITDHLSCGGLLVVDNLFGKYLHQKRENTLPAESVLEDFYEEMVSSPYYRVFAFSWEDGILVGQKL
ncbi:MAG: O-methyltransferase [Brevinematales bacterium]